MTVFWIVLLALMLNGMQSFRMKRRGKGREKLEVVASDALGVNATESVESKEGICWGCDSYGWATCGVCTNCKWRGGKCMHKCTSCCAYSGGCNVDYCICDGQKNVFEDMWKNCGSGSKAKTYYFQMLVPNGTDGVGDRFIAIEFRRTGANPQLVLHFDQEWTVKMKIDRTLRDREKDNWQSKQEWMVMPAAGSTHAPKTEITDLKDAEYIRAFKDVLGPDKNMSATALEVKFPDDRKSIKIYGGMYIPQLALDYAIDKFWNDTDTAPKDEFGVFVSEPQVDQTKRGPTHKAHFWVRKLLLDFLEDYHKKEEKYNTTFDGRIIAFKPGQLRTLDRAAHIGAVSGSMVGMVAGSSLVATLGPLALPLTLPLYFFAAFGGALSGISLGAAAMLVDNLREVRLLASEKIFEKMRCHKLFERCGGTAIAPVADHGQCPL